MSDLVDFSSAGQTAYFRRLLPTDVPLSLVDVGAGDGLTASNSRQLMIEGWRGLLIEPQPDKFTALEKNYRGSPQATCLPLNFRERPLTAVLQESGIPPLFGVLLLNTPDDEAVLQSLNLHLFRPTLIVTADQPQDPERRRQKYRRLIDQGFVFCGAVGKDSIWAGRSVDPPAVPPLAARLPPALIEGPPSIAVPSFCLDTPSAAVTKTWGGVLPVEGWMFELENSGRENSVVLELTDCETGAIHRVATVKTPRPDVAAHFSLEHLLFCGFRANISLSVLRPAFYDLSLILVNESLVIARTPKVSRIHVALHSFELAARGGLAEKFLFGTGIEIGALQRALPLGPGCQVRYIDRMPVSDLIAHYPELAGLPIQSPDIVDDGELLLDIASDSQNFLVANHFFEHCQNPIRTLLNLARVLQQGGVIFMAVPDKRYTRDLPRPVTPYETLRQAFLTNQRDQPEILFREWAESWEGLTGEAARVRGGQLMDQQYSIHYNVWALSDLLDFLLRAKAEFHLPFEITSVVSSENENILILTKLAG